LVDFIKQIPVTLVEFLVTGSVESRGGELCLCTFSEVLRLMGGLMGIVEEHVVAKRRNGGMGTEIF
jgi:hypothetical protein